MVQLARRTCSSFSPIGAEPNESRHRAIVPLRHSRSVAPQGLTLRGDGIEASREGLEARKAGKSLRAGCGASDLLILLVSWGPCANCKDCPADLNGDCTVGTGDLILLLVNWG